jgi:hypothetical protein
LLQKIKDFCSDLLANFESICEHMVSKFAHKDNKKRHFRKQEEFRKNSIDEATSSLRKDGVTG